MLTVPGQGVPQERSARAPHGVQRRLLLAPLGESWRARIDAMPQVYGEGNSSFDRPDNQYAKSAAYSLRANTAFSRPAISAFEFRKSTGSACTANPTARKAPMARGM